MEKTKYNLPSISYKGSADHYINWFPLKSGRVLYNSGKVYAHESLTGRGYTENLPSTIVYDYRISTVFITGSDGEQKVIHSPEHSAYIIYEDDTDNECYTPYCHHQTERTVIENCNPDGHDEITFTCLICGNKETIFKRE